LRSKKSPRQKLLTELAAAYSLCVSQGEDFIWDAYAAKLKEAVLTKVKYNIEPDPENAEACRKYEKQIRIAVLNLHTEVQQFYYELAKF
jgi:hypothetical protein